MTSIEVIIVKNEGLINTAFGSYETCEKLYKILLSKNRDTKMSLCTNEKDLQDVVDRNPDMVILTNKIMITENKKIWLSEYFEIQNIVYTGSIKTSLQYDICKTAAKSQVSAHGIETARFFTAIPGQYKRVEELPIPFPLFIKPLESANSNGIDEKSFVINFSDFQTKVKSLYTIYKQPILIEQYLSGREFTVSIIKTDMLLIAPIEIVAPLKNDIRILSKNIKDRNSETLKQITDMNIFKKVSDIALSSFGALGIRDFGRIDIKMDAQEKCYFMEANLTPGMTNGNSYFPRAFEICSRMKYDSVVFSMFREAIKRSQKK